MTNSLKIAGIIAILTIAAPAAATTVDFEECTRNSIASTGTEFVGIIFDQYNQVGQFGFIGGPS